MNIQLKLLIELQEMDNKIAELNGALDNVPRRQEALRSGYQREEQALREYKAALDVVGKERRAAERELENYEDSIRKVKEKQFMVKTNKEYQTMIHEVTQMEEKKGLYEEKVLLLMDKGGELEKKIKTQEGKLTAEKAVYISEEAKLLQEKAGLESEKAFLLKERRTIVSQVDEEFLRSYQRLMDFHHGTAVVGVIDGICQGCFIALRPQSYQEVKRNAEILTCDQCKRILYLKEVKVENPPDPEGKS